MNRNETLIGTESKKFPLLAEFNHPEELFASVNNILFEVVCDCMVSKITKQPLLNKDGSNVQVGSPLVLLGIVGSDDVSVLKYSDDFVENTYQTILNNFIQNEEYEMCETLHGLYEIYNS